MVLLKIIFSVAVFLVLATAKDVPSTKTESVPESTTEIKDYISQIFPEDFPPSNDTIDPSFAIRDRVRPGEIPWHAYLRQTRSNGTLRCGGSLIRPTWVITAAHCILDPGKIVVHLGGIHINNMLYRQTAISKIVHENYNSTTRQNDVGLVKLPVAASGTTIQPITLAPDSVGSLAGILMRVSGFVRTTGQSSPELLKATLRGISNEECSRSFKNIVSSSLCANYYTKTGQNPCQGERSGLDVLAGVVTFGGTNSDQGLPSVYARVSSFRLWASNNMERNS